MQTGEKIWGSVGPRNHILFNSEELEDLYSNFALQSEKKDGLKGWGIAFPLLFPAPESGWGDGEPGPGCWHRGTGVPPGGPGKQDASGVREPFLASWNQPSPPLLLPQGPQLRLVFSDTIIILYSVSGDNFP